MLMKFIDWQKKYDWKRQSMYKINTNEKNNFELLQHFYIQIQADVLNDVKDEIKRI